LGEGDGRKLDYRCRVLNTWTLVMKAMVKSNIKNQRSK
jgi:hypothetical protein